MSNQNESSLMPGPWTKVGPMVLLLGMCVYAMYSAPAAPAGFTDGDGPMKLVGFGLGFAIGCYGTIVGIGGGPIVMPILYTLHHYDSEVLVANCLFIVFLNALSGSVGYSLQGRVDYTGALKFSAAAIPGAIVMSTFHHLVDVTWFNTAFGVFLLVLAIHSSLSADRVDAPVRLPKRRRFGFRRVRLLDSSGERFDFFSNDRLGVNLNIVLGGLSGFLGIGGGVLQVPILLYLLRYPPHVATATSHFVTMVTCLAAVAPHLIFGNVHYGETAWMGAGVIAGAQLGAKVARNISSKTIIYLFAVVLIVFAAKLLFA